MMRSSKTPQGQAKNYELLDDISLKSETEFTNIKNVFSRTTRYWSTVNVTYEGHQISKNVVPLKSWKRKISFDLFCNYSPSRELICLNLSSLKCNCQISLTPTFIKIQSGAAEISHMAHGQSVWCHAGGNNLILKMPPLTETPTAVYILVSSVPCQRCPTRWKDEIPSWSLGSTFQRDHQFMFHFSKWLKWLFNMKGDMK